MEKKKGVHGCRYRRKYNYFDDYDRLCMHTHTHTEVDDGCVHRWAVGCLCA
jgi:hypothetical protein